MKNKIFPLVLLCTLWYTSALPQAGFSKTVKPFFGKAGIKRNIASLHRPSLAASATPRKLDSTSLKPYKSYFKRYSKIARPSKGNSTGIFIRHGPDDEGEGAMARPATVAPSEGTQKIWSNFLGIDFNDNPIGWPPDPNGAVGPSQVIIATNNGLKVFDKKTVTDAPVVSPKGYSDEKAHSTFFISLEDFFSPVLPIESGISDPHIRYDRLSKRWIVVAVEVNPSFENNLILLAISDGEKITDASSFTYYSFNSSLFPYDPTAPYAPFLDYPRMGVDKNAILIGGNQFGWDSLTNVGYVIDKKKLLHGELVVYPFELGVASFIDGSVSGMYTPVGAQNDDGAATKSFFTGISYFQDQVIVARLDYDKNKEPFLSKVTAVDVEPFNNPRDNSHPGSLIPLQQNDTRLFTADIYKNQLTGKTSLFTSHGIGVNQAGHLIDGSDSDFVREARTGVRWYQLTNVYNKPHLNQVGTLHDDETKSGRRAVQYFNPTVAASGQGHVVVAGTTDAFDQYLNVFVAGHYYGDEKGTLRKPEKATNTTAMYAPYVDFGGGSKVYVERWGDFSQTVVDPMDDQTIWTFQEYANIDDSYGVRAVQLKAPPPATPLPLGTLSNTSDTLVTLNAVSVDNSGFFDPGNDAGGPGYNRLSVKSTGGIIVSNVYFASPTQIKFRLRIKNKAPGKYSVIITNPDGQLVATEYTVEAAPPSPSSRVALAQQGSDKISKQYIVASDIYPNPNGGSFNLQLNAAKAFSGRVLLIEAGGKVIGEKKFSLGQGTDAIPLSLSNAGNGNYLAAVYNASNTLIAVHKIVKTAK